MTLQFFRALRHNTGSNFHQDLSALYRNRKTETDKLFKIPSFQMRCHYCDRDSFFSPSVLETADLMIIKKNWVNKVCTAIMNIVLCEHRRDWICPLENAGTKFHQTNSYTVNPSHCCHVWKISTELLSFVYFPK